jgi:hypothetical protein
MRPTKLTQQLLDAFRAVLDDELAVIAFTEEELVWQANQHLPVADQITYRTYQRYKADILLNETQPDCRQAGTQDTSSGTLSPAPGEKGHKTQANATMDQGPSFETRQASTMDHEENTELVRQMHVTLTSALLKQKLALVKGIYAAEPNWRRYAWMLERKFPDFRLKMPVRSTVESPQSTDKTKQPSPEARQALTELEQMERKWGKGSNYTSPWYQGPEYYVFYLTPENVRDLEEEMANDIAKGYVNPYANLGYQPATCPPGIDYNDYENGWYNFFAMGTKTPRLPLRLWMPEHIEPADIPSNATKEILWAKQEWQRQHPNEPYLNENGEPENIDVFVPPPRQRNRREHLTDPWDNAPTDPASPGGGQIWGSSVG